MPGNLKMLIVDDEPNMLHMLRSMIERHGYQVSTAENGGVALDLINKDRFDFVLCDVKMPVVDGLTFLEKGAAFLEQTTVIMMSAYGTIDLALEAMKAGAYDFISKPFKADEVIMTLKKAEERERLRRENVRLKQVIADFKGRPFATIVAVSDGIREVVELARKIASYDTTVLITGESGTGKELVAQGIHEHSERREKPFVAINCGSIPENLLESELFGYVKGAFTGADENRKGLLDEANGSTLFLDEIGELPLALQVKLLRVLQEKEIRPLGSKKEIKVDIRIVAATADNLFDRVSQGTFREDLFYRLNVVPIRIPPLRKRLDDVPVLAQHFLDKYSRSLGTEVKGISPEAMELLTGYKWPGNVRELENCIQRAMVVSGSGTVMPDHLPKRIQERVVDSLHENDDDEQSLSIKKAQRQFEARLIRKALKVCAGNKSRASELLEISYPSLLKKIKQYHL